MIVRGFIVEAGLGHGIEVPRRHAAIASRPATSATCAQLGIRVSGGAGHRVEACDIHDTGTGGLVLAGGDRKTLTPAGHEAVNNHIWRFSRHQLTYAYAASARRRRQPRGAQPDPRRPAPGRRHQRQRPRLRVQRRPPRLHRDRRRRRALQGPQPLLPRQRRSATTSGTTSAARWATATRRSTSTTATAATPSSATSSSAAAIRAGAPSAPSSRHGGHDNLAENNIFIECKRALGSAPWDDERWKETLEGGEDCYWQKLLLRKSTSPSRRTRRATRNWSASWTRSPASRGSIGRGTTCWSAAARSAAATGHSSRRRTGHRPGPRFRRRRQRRLPAPPRRRGFQASARLQPIPFDKIGVYQNPLCLQWPNRESDGARVNTPRKRTIAHEQIHPNSQPPPPSGVCSDSADPSTAESASTAPGVPLRQRRGRGRENPARTPPGQLRQDRAVHRPVAIVADSAAVARRDAAVSLQRHDDARCCVQLRRPPCRDPASGDRQRRSRMLLAAINNFSFSTK